MVLALMLSLTSCESNKLDAEPKRPADAITPFMNLHETERMNDVAESARRSDVDLVFLGDSITDYWRMSGKDVWEEFYGSRRAVNFGIGMAETGNLLWRIHAGHFDVIRPQLIVLMIGTNNTQYGKHSPQQIAEGIATIIENLKARQPAAKILLLGIFPRGKTSNDPYRLNNEAANRIIAELGDGKQVVYRDIGEIFLEPGGSIRPDITTDNLHLNALGYRLWAEAIEEDIARLLSE
jgi:lysophospholipase L1-like esterase